MPLLDIAATVAVLAAFLITFVGMFWWLSGLVEQAEADGGLEDLSSNREMEPSLVSYKERSSSASH